MKLRMGVSPYINGLVPDYDFELPGVSKVYDVPSVICRKLRSGELDISFVSSVEYFRYPERYFILPEICVCSQNEVDSVGVFARHEPEHWEGKNFLLSPDSETSNALFRVICKHYLHKEVNYCLPKQARACLSDYMNLPVETDGFVSIGDITQILKKQQNNWLFYDLGRLWADFSGLNSFVFGLWLVRREFALQNMSQVKEAHNALCASVRKGLRNIAEIYRKGNFSMDAENFREFLQERLSYKLGPVQEKALHLFGRLLNETEQAQLHFLPLSFVNV